MNKEKRTAKSSTMDEGLGLLFLLCLGIAVLYWGFFIGENALSVGERRAIFAVGSAVITLLTVPIALHQMRVYYLDETGIRCVWLGRCCRRIPWSEVKDISRVPVKYGAALLVTTKEGAGRKLKCSMRQDEQFYIKESADVLACVGAYYGCLDDDCRR